MNPRLLLVGTCACLPLLAGATRGPDEPAANPKPAASTAAQPKPEAPAPALLDREKRLLEIAQTYPTYRLGSPWPEWALAMCRLVTAKEVTGVPSRSDDERTHGTKLYKLWVSDYDSYMRLSGVEPSPSMFPPDKKAAAPLTLSPIGQTLVKETFAAVEVPKAEEPNPNPYRHDLIVDGGRAYRQGAPGELFIMTKLDPKTPDTDLGWVYAIVSADHKTVLQSGRIETCMHCHERTTRDRLYGPESTWPKDSAGKPTPPVVRREHTDNPNTATPAAKEPNAPKSDH